MKKEQFAKIADTTITQDVTAFVALSAKHFPNAVAVKYNTKQLTYTQLELITTKIAGQLNQIGIKPGSLVGVCLPRSLKLPVAVLAILKCGAAYVPFDSEYPQERLQYMQKTAGVKFLISNKELSSIFGNVGLDILDIDTLVEQAEKRTSLDLPNTDARNLCYVLFTSGSTGNPKGVAMPHTALVNLIKWQIKNSDAFENSSTLQFAPISFDVSFQEIFCTWAVGGTLVMIDDELRLNAPHLLKFLAEQKIARLFLPFIALQHLAEVAATHKNIIPTLTEVITAGEQLQVTPYVVDFFTNNKQATLWNHYGPTETHVITAVKLTGNPGQWDALPSIGKPIDNCEVVLLDENNKIIKDNREGELFAKGICLASGYINNKELTAERFIPNPTDGGKTLLYKTGDLAKYLPDGNIQYLGRIDGQVKVRGYRIELGEVEICIAKHANVNACAVTVREEQAGNKRLIAYVVPKESSSYNVTDLRNHVASLLPDYMQPSAYVQMTELPRTPSGKIDRKALPAPEINRPVLNTEYIAPQTELQKTMAAMWCTILQINEVGINDNFFELGGNSLLALKFTSSLLQLHYHDLPVTKVFQSPTIFDLASFIENGDSFTSQLQDTRTRFANTQSNEPLTVEDGIAIIGMACKFPGANTVEQLWNNLVEGKESVTFFKNEELDPSVNDEQRNDPSYIKARGIINGAENFDAAFFGINPKVADLTDPQHRILLQLSVEALERASINPNTYNGLIGVYAGTGNNTYYQKNVVHYPKLIEQVGEFLTMTSNEKDYIATRIAYELNLKGPALSIHTACSTSLVSIVTATDQLLEHKCDVAIAGGVAITSPIMSGYTYNEGSMNSADGHCRPFDKDARGTMFSDGAGLIVLKRYKEAVRDGDTIYAVIRGGALNNDGGGKASFTAPSVDGQAQVIALAHAKANVNADSISYVEAHGTATPIGDPIEVEGLTKAFNLENKLVHTSGLGSIKGNFGHLTAAAGVAGLIKVVLQLQHKKLVPTINYQSPNPQIKFENTPFHVIDKLQDWTNENNPLRAGVSSFGVGGTNAHLILEEAPKQQPSGIARPVHTLMLSAKNTEALQRYKTKVLTELKSNEYFHPADFAFSFQTGRAHFAAKQYYVYGDRDELINLIEKNNPKLSSTYQHKGATPAVAFMFPGQGSQYVNMGKALYDNEIIFRQHADMCFDILKTQLQIDLKAILYPADGNEAAAEENLKQTQYTQPALFVIGYSLAQLYMSWGIKPAKLIGHSIGEFVAACIAGVFSLDDAIMLVGSRAKLMQAMPKGSMLSVRMPYQTVQPLLNKNCAVAAINGAELCVVSGPTEDIVSLQTELEKEDIACKLLHTSHAFHSPMMDPVLPDFEKVVRKVKLNAPQIPIVSTVNANILTDEKATDIQYWTKHLRVPVRFAEGVKQLWADDSSMVLLECGPRNTATQMAKQQATDVANQFAIPSLPDRYEYKLEWQTMCAAIGHLWLKNIIIDWKNYYALETRKHIPVTTYPFEEKRHWLDIPVTDTKLDVPSNKNIAPTINQKTSIATSLVQEQLKLMQMHLQLMHKINKPKVEAQ